MDEWGGEVEIKAMSIGQQLGLRSLADNDLVMLHIVQQSVINEDGSLLFEDIDDLENKSADSILKLYNEINSINKDDESIENAAKNS